MPRPVLLTVDDDPDVLRDQRMPDLDGVGFLAQATELYPTAKRALLTAYADTNAAIDAINEAKVHYFLMKPWDPPEENLYPALDDLLNDWADSYHPPYEGIRLLGTRWSSHAYELRNFLARNHVPYQWVDVELNAADSSTQALLKNEKGEADTLPLLIFPDATRLSDPSPMAVAQKIGLRTHSDVDFYDLAIIGGGPAGLAAAVYGASEGLKTVMIEREAPGGQAGLSSRIENYLGFPSGLSGLYLACVSRALIASSNSRTAVESRATHFCSRPESSGGVWGSRGRRGSGGRASTTVAA